MPLALDKKLDKAFGRRGLALTLKLLSKLALNRFSETNIVEISSSMTLATVLSIVPLLAVALAMFSVIPAFAVYRKTCPAYIEDISEIHRTEPYVYSQMVAGKDAPTFGEAKNSWLTGTAAWTFFNISQYILGIQPTLDGLKVDPCIPHTLSGFTVTRRFRGAVYHITVDNAAGVQHGIKAVTVDGKAISGNVLPLAAAGAEVTVQVTMG